MTPEERTYQLIMAERPERMAMYGLGLLCRAILENHPDVHAQAAGIVRALRERVPRGH
jgi:hypothetical protein